MKASKEILKIGLFGYGYWGRIYHRVLSEIDGIELSYVCDLNSNVRTNVPKSITFFDDIFEALDNGGADSVFVITPAVSHKEIIINSLKRGLDVFVEKPAVLSSADLSEIISKKGANSIFFPGHIYAYNDLIKSFARVILESGEELHSISTWRMAPGPVRNDVGCIWDLLPHDLTIFDLLGIGVPVSVSCKGRRILNLKNEDTAHCEIRYSSGLVACADLNWTFPKKTRIALAISDKYIFMLDETNRDFPAGFVRFEKSLVEGLNSVAFNGLKAGQFMKRIDSARTEPLKNMVKSFLLAVASGNHETEMEEIVRAKRIIATIEASFISMYGDGHTVNIKIRE